MVLKIDNQNHDLHLNTVDEKPPIFERRLMGYQDLSKKFTSIQTDFSKQFAHIYAVRLEELRAVLTDKILNKWGKENIKIVRLADLEGLEGQECAVIGTLYKHQQWKPSILRELSEEHQLTLPEPRSDYCCEKDQPFLEDEMLRIKLVGEKVNLKEIITGIVCAIRGSENPDGTFMVKEWCYPGIPKPLSKVIPTPKGKLVLVSGLNIDNNDHSLALNLLSEWLCGMAGDAVVQQDGSSVVRVIFAGNTVKGDDKTHANIGHSEGKAQDIAIAKQIAQATQKADAYLSNIAQCCCVTLIPGEHDPTNMMLPQKPMHPCLLPKASKYQSFSGASNPWISNVGERIITGTSGQPIKDLVKASGDTESSPIQWLERTLDWRHICPTAPDTLLACPYYEKDLFIMKECPDIYFAGNTQKFETKLWKGNEGQVVRLISVPEFSTTHTAIIVDLENLNTEYIRFGSFE